MSTIKCMCMALLCNLSYLSLLPADKTALIKAAATASISQQSPPIPPLNLQKVRYSKSADDVEKPTPSRPSDDFDNLEEATYSKSADYLREASPEDVIQFLESIAPGSQTHRSHLPLSPRISPDKKIRDLLAAFS